MEHVLRMDDDGKQCSHVDSCLHVPSVCMQRCFQKFSSIVSICQAAPLRCLPFAKHRIWNYGFNTSIAWNLIDGITYLGVNSTNLKKSIADCPIQTFQFQQQMVNLAGWIARDRLQLVFYEPITFDKFLKPLLILEFCVAAVGMWWFFQKCLNTLVNSLMFALNRLGHVSNVGTRQITKCHLCTFGTNNRILLYHFRIVYQYVERDRGDPFLVDLTHPFQQTCA